MKNKLLWGLVGLLVLSFIVIGLSSRKSSSVTGDTTDLQKYPVTENDHWYGNRNAKVVIVEYGDFQCPACASYSALLKQAVEIYKGEVAIVFRHFPLIEIHPRALASAKVAEASGMQGKFFEMLDLLYANQSEWVNANDPTAVFSSYATKLGLNIDKFNGDLKLTSLEDKIKRDRDEARTMKLSGTPSLFINGKLIPLPQNGTEFQKVIENELTNANTKTQ